MEKPTSSSFWDHPIAHLEEALTIRRQIETLKTRLSVLMDVKTAEAPVKRANKKPPQTTGSAPVAAKAAARGKVKPKGITPEGRAKLSAEKKAWWAAKRAAAGKA